MASDQDFQKRIGYSGDLKPLLISILSRYDFGEYVDYEIKNNGYEDFNLILHTSQKTVFLKCFASWRSKKDCQRYVEMIETARVKGEVRTPTLYENKQKDFLTGVEIEGETINLAIMQFLDGGNIWESMQPISIDEQAEIIRQAARINLCEYRPIYSKDSWAIINASATYLQNKKHIDSSDKLTIENLLDQLGKVNIDALPHSFVHGDMRSTNVMRHNDGQIYIIDFSVANWYPRIIELAVLFSDILFDPDNLDGFNKKYEWVIDEYRRAGISLSFLERDLLPLFIKLGHAMSIIGSSSIAATNYISKDENEHWRTLGRIGLNYTVNSWRY